MTNQMSRVVSISREMAEMRRFYCRLCAPVQYLPSLSPHEVPGDI